MLKRMFAATGRSAFTVLRSSLVLTIGILVASSAEAECSATATANVSGGVVTMTGTSTGACGGSTVTLYLDGNPVGANGCSNSSSCSVTVTRPTACMSGTHEVKALAACNRPRTNPDGSTSCLGDDARFDWTHFTVSSKPAISISYNGPDGQGKGKLDVTYNFPNTTDSDQRTINVFVEGVFYQNHHPETVSGTWSPDLPVTCRTTGTYIIEAFALACSGINSDLTDGASTTVTVNTQPSVGVSYSPNEFGKGRIDVTYGFPNTADAGQRLLELYIDDTFVAFHRPEQQQGTWSVERDPACAEPQRVHAKAAACSPADLQADAETTIPKSSPPSITALTLLNVGDHMEGTVGWDMGEAKTGWGVRGVRMKWITGDGKIHEEDPQLLFDFSPETRTGTRKFTVVPPGGAQQVVVEAVASSCAGEDKKVVSAECGSCDATADPVYFADGNVQVTDGDPLPPIGNQSLVRTYNSREQVVALFGRGWTTLFERRLIVTTRAADQIVSIVTEANEVVTFRGVAGAFRQTWPTARQSRGVLTLDTVSGMYTHRPAGSTEAAVFRATDGRLLALRDIATGREAQISYDPQGLPQSLTDSWSGISWNLTIDPVNRRVSSIAVSGRPDLVWSYQYDADGNLTTVLAPGGATWRTYEHSANRMTASYDALGNLIESHTYDANGYGISSTGPTDEIAAMAYNLPGSVAEERVTRVTYKTGATAEYALRPAGGAYRPVRVTGGCSSCGAGDATYVHDRDGRVIREQGADGYVTLRTYGATSLASEERFLRPAGCDPETDAQRCRLGPDALATAPLQPTTETIKTTFAYADPLWPDRVTAIVKPSVRAPGRERREDYAYHPVTGALVSTGIRGWTGDEPTDTDRVTRTTFYGDVAPCNPRGDDGCAGGADSGLAPAFNPGGTFDGAWLTLPQPAGLSKSIDGSRVDVQDVSFFVYYPNDASVPALLRGRLAATKNAAGHITRYESYDIFGNATRVVDANGVAVEATYDTLGRLVTSTTKGVAGCDTVRDPLCATDLVTERTYASAGPLTTEESPSGSVTTYTYDARARVRTISRGSSAADLRERIESSYDPLTGKKSLERTLGWESGAWVEKKREAFAYDAEGRLQTMTHADGAFVQYAYDAADRVSGVRDENHAAPNTRYAYDSAGRLATVVQTLAGAPGGAITTRYTYDAHGNLVSVTDPNGNITTYVYDDFGQLLRQSSPVTGVTTYTYDDAGNVLSTTDANSVTTIRTYDALGRVTAAIAATGEEGHDEEVRWAYDTGSFGIGRLASMNDPTGSTSYAYERRGRLASEVKTIAGTAYITGYGYDATGNRSRITYPSGRAVAYAFDYADRPVSASTGSTMLVTSARYLPFGPATEIAFGNGTIKQISFDARYRPLTNTLGVGEGDLIASYGYGYDPAGNITAIHDALDPSFNRDCGYDDLHRLTTANSGEGLWGAGSYSYDSMGNMRVATLGSRSDAAFRYQGTTPKLSSVTENGEDRGVTYDAAGNELAAGTASYEYTLRNHLARQNGVLYTYDGRGVRTITLRPASILAFNVPSTISGGSSAQGEIVLSSPAPAGGAVVALTSSNAVAFVPATVTVSVGETTATFTIATQSVTGQQSAVLTATFNGSVRTATLSVTGSRFDDVSVNPQMIVGGESARGTVALAGVAPEGGVAVALESSSAAIRIPEGIIVPGGERTADFPVITAPVAERTVARITASVSGEGRETALTILPPSVIALAFTPAVLNGGSSTTGAVTLSGRAPESGQVVALTSAPDMLSLPATVFVAAGERSATFTATATPVEVAISVPITASAGESSVTADITIEPPHLTDLTVTPATVVGGESLAAEVTINAPAAPEGARVQLSTSDPESVPAPAHVFVPSGETSETTSLPTSPVAAPTPVVVSATRSGITRSATVTIEPPAVTIASFSIAPVSLVGTNEALATVTLTGIAPAGGVEIQITSSNRSIATAPSAITVPSGLSHGTFAIETSLVAAPADVIITAAHATTEKSVPLTVLPPNGNYLATVSVSPTFIVGGTTATATVTLAMPSSESGGSDIVVSSSAPVLAVPSTVKINPNSSSATFTVTATPVAQPVAVTLTATYGGVVQRARVIVAPENAVTIGSLAITPDRVIGGTASTGAVTLTAAAPFGGAVVNLEARRRNIVTMPATVTVPEGANSATFPIGTQVVHGNKDRSLEIVAAYNGVTASATLTVTPSPTISASAGPVVLCASAALEPCLTQTALHIATASTTIYDRQYNLYTPELSLLAETAATVTSAPPVAYEYIWFAGQPLAQVNVAANEIHYYFNDHLGAPILQTDATARVVWRVEYDPYGKIHGMRRGEAKHQPLRFPGQEGDASGELSYNVFRWYRSGWGRYTTPDPLGFEEGATNPFAYVGGNPLRGVDPFGLVTVNITPMPTQIVDNDTLRNMAFPGGAGGQFLYGFLLSGRSVDCICKCENGYWRPTVTINVAYQIWASTCPNCPLWPTVTQIIEQEEIHVAQLLESTKQLANVAKGMEARNYPAKFACDLDCWGLKAMSKFTFWLPGFTEKVPGLSPHPHLH